MKNKKYYWDPIPYVSYRTPFTNLLFMLKLCLIHDESETKGLTLLGEFYTILF